MLNKNKSPSGWLVLASCCACFVLLIFGVSRQVYAQVPSRDSQQPVEISADQLEVLQSDQKAIFSGNVIAKQGRINMKSSRMTVFYKGGGDKQQSASAMAGAAKGISRIEADGDVFFASPTETARSKKASYDVDKEMITMTGDVVLTRDRNVLKGSQLIYNLTTGKSVLNSSGNSGGTGGGRVKGLFIPQQKE